MTTLETTELNSAARTNAEGRRSPQTRANPDLIRRHITDDNICVLTFDRPDSSANIFDRTALAQLDDHLNFIESNSSLQGLVVCSAKKSIFIAGADIHSLAGISEPAEIRALVELGQAVFSRLARLRIPTVAAIHGACLGGGYEICLACHYRLATPDRATKIGLPETQLGILPAWGGSTRLPRLIGVPKALDIILGGKTLAAKPALRSGLVDDLVPREYLVEFACKRIRELGPRLRRRAFKFSRLLSNRSIVATLLRKKLQADILKKTRGHYPAVLKALEVVTRGITTSIEESLALEREAMVELAQTEVCKNLIRVFFLQERAKKLFAESSFSQSDVGQVNLEEKSEAVALKRLAVIGAGVMGAGIAQWSSARVFAWTFLVPVVAVVIEALQGNLPGALATAGLAIVITGVAIVTHPRAEATPG
jgi:3-hydroxyacyl-CoA dehydrogenase/enoyl-CoA hydratase/3-hydroxybutyryl-CoA epimerase